VATESTSITRARSIDLAVVDCVLAGLLLIGALVDAGALSGRRLGAVSVLSVAALTGSVAVRRRSAVLATVVAATGLAVFERASGYAGDGAFEAAASAACLYLLGRHARPRPAPMSVLAFVYWLGSSFAAGYSEPGGAGGNSLFWVLCGGLPFAVGYTLAVRAAAGDELKLTAGRLQSEQVLRARHAADEERSRMARELHDVVAHCVSVMVVQTSGARRIAASDLGAAREALKVVESAGREALVELRRIVGVLYRGEDEPAGASPGLGELEVLVDRARSAGLPVEVSVEGPRRSLSPGLDLVAYRIVQESLTNAIKHAGPAEARVHVVFCTRDLELEITDSGRGSGRRRREDGSGHGLIGMSERVRLYGGELHAGPRPSGGFEVRARIPLDGGVSALGQLSESRADRDALSVEVSTSIAWRSLDPLLAGGFLVGLEVMALTGGERGGVRLRDVLVLAAMALACIWRRRQPLWFLIAVVALVFGLSRNLAPSSALLTAVYVGLLPAYAVAAWEDRRRAQLGLAIEILASAVGVLLIRHLGAANYAAPLFTICAAWAAGRAIRARRATDEALERTTSLLAAEHDDRVRLAVAGERSRIVRDLHAVVARNVAAMVVQAEAARGRLHWDPATADGALEAVEDVGRQALGEMRRILGVLRQRDQAGELLEPQPGVDQIHRLIERAREQGQQVELTISGQPGTLSAGVDLATYRILEEALASIRSHPATAMCIALRFEEQDLELQLTTTYHGARDWPTDAMRQRVLMCEGALSSEEYETYGERLTARLPRGLQGVLT
jgi:signal transduction histidine kinase